MADAKQVSSPSVSGDKGLVLTAPANTGEETTAPVTVTGENASNEEGEETPEARVLPQGLCSHSASPLYYHLSRVHDGSRILLCRYEPSI